MKAHKPLKDLPGFNEAMGLLLEHHGESFSVRWAGDIGAVVLPGIRRISSWDLLWQLALIMGHENYDRSRRPMRIVPPLHPVAANDCEASQ